MTDRWRVFLRVGLFLVAMVAVVAIVGLGVRSILLRPIVAPAGEKPGQGEETQSRSLTHTLLGIYLGFRQGEVNRAADPTNKSKVAFTVSPGETAATIGPRLERMGLVRDGALFTVLVRFREVDRGLEVGEYELSPSMTMGQIADELQHGRAKTITVTIPEGWRLEQVAAKLAEAGLGTEEEFLALLRKHDYPYPWLQDWPADAPDSLEGFLFPDTYQVPVDATPIAVVDMMLRNFDRQVTPDLRKGLSAQGLSLYQGITLAAIVEREAVVAEERPTIAAVFLQRLDRGMYLQADPTVSYAKGFDAGEKRWWTPMAQEDAKEVDSPYNTFQHPGLTPGPICSPGLSSIDAVADPARTNYLYFVSKGDGSHAFSETYDEHLLNVQKYQNQ